jgi:hypothetical protein
MTVWRTVPVPVPNCNLWLRVTSRHRHALHKVQAKRTLKGNYPQILQQLACIWRLGQERNTHFTTRRSTVRTTEPPLGKIANFRSSLLSCTSNLWYLINSSDTEIRVTIGTSSHHRHILTSVQSPPSPENDIYDKFSTGTRPGYNTVMHLAAIVQIPIEMFFPYLKSQSHVYLTS